MDLLFKRYASPYSVMDEMIKAGLFEEFLVTLYEKNTEEMQWDIWLHKIHNISFQEYKEEVKKMNTSYAMTESQAKATIENARNILRGFRPN